MPDLQYVRDGDIAVAYQAIGDGEPVVVFLPFLSNLYMLWRFPLFTAFCERLAAVGRLLVVNPRGIGLSDRPRGVTLEARAQDILAVLDREGVGRAALLGIRENANVCALFAATYPERCERLALFTPYARAVRGPDYPFGSSQEDWLASIRRTRERWGDRDYLEAMAREINPQLADDPEYLEFFVWDKRLAASPAAAADFRRLQMDTDISGVLSSVRVPTLVLYRSEQRDESQYVAERIPGASAVELPGTGGPFVGEAPIAAIERFLHGEPSPEIPDTVLATLVFTDLVGSTERAAELGDRRWRQLLDEYRHDVRRELARFRGVELDTAGDGFLASFDGPARAIACGRAILACTDRLALETRVGIHTGECERSDGKLVGLALHIGARVAGAARGGQVLVSGTVRDLVAGSGFAFDDLGERELKGVPGIWRLYAVTD